MSGVCTWHGSAVSRLKYRLIKMFVVNGSPFLNQDRVAHWDMCLEFETGRKVYTHRFLICAAFQFFEGLFETELDEWYFYKMPPPQEQPVTADMMCLMLSFLYEDWQVSGVTNDRLKCQVQARQEC